MCMKARRLQLYFIFVRNEIVFREIEKRFFIERGSDYKNDIYELRHKLYLHFSPPCQCHKA